jgi:hypothetical protein
MPFAPSFRNAQRDDSPINVLTRSERCSELEEPVDYLKCVFSALYRGGHLFRWVQRVVPAPRPRGIGCPRGEFPVPVAPCPALHTTNGDCFH